MRTFDNGCFYTVHCSAKDVYEFARQWPGFGNRSAIAFQFDKRNGDLVDISRDTDDNDASGIVALANDAQAYGRKRLKLS